MQVLFVSPAPGEMAGLGDVRRHGTSPHLQSSDRKALQRYGGYNGNSMRIYRKKLERIAQDRNSG